VTTITDPLLADLLDFLGASPTPYHAVASAAQRLEAHGFTRVDDRANWQGLAWPGRFYAVQGETTLLAWVHPQKKSVQEGVAGFRIVGAHTDSPNLRLKPRAAVRREGYEQVGVEVYGGALVNSWLDRDLGIAGRLVVAGGSRLVRIHRPLFRVPQLAIHLDRDVNDKGLVLNKQQHLLPITALTGGDEIDVVSLCAREAGVPREQVVGSDLMLYDVVPPTIAGAKDEFVFSGRLDNLAMSHAATAALTAAAADLEAGSAVGIIALFDHEEVGSESAAGAASAFLPRVLERIVLASGKGRDDYLRALAGSRCVSADMAHAVHPNYADRHDAQHRPALNGGPVLKVNAQQRYATSAATAALFTQICREVDVPLQHYAHRTDLPCGSTIGPIVSTRLGIPTVDVGNPMLSMHSIREMAGARDAAMMTRALARFLTRPE
jgi:aspartyl aminopeptidase